MKRSALTFALICFEIFTATANAEKLPSFEEFKGTFKTSEVTVLDRHGQPLQQLRTNSKFRRLGWTPLSKISPALLEATLKSEDQRFYEHHGVDWLAILNAGFNKLKSPRENKLRGASTITMQVVGLLFQEVRTKRKNWNQKISQALLARDLEKQWSKDQILEAYLNTLSFRGELQGIEAAAQGLFSKSPHGLDRDESLILASLIRAPQASVAQVTQRACALGSSLDVNFACSGVSSKLTVGLQPQPPSQKLNQLPHLGQDLHDRNRTSEKISSTIDARIQNQVHEILGDQLRSLAPLNVKDAAALVVDNRTGEILAYVGGTNQFSSAIYVDGVRARRQAGSTLKPFIYALAFQKRILTPASLVSDLPTEFSVSGGIYQPHNYDQQFKGENISASEALASSLNVPAVKALDLVGVRNFYQKLIDLGFQIKNDPDFFGPSLALGSVDVSLYELVNAYRVLANGGALTPLFDSVTPSHSQTRPFSKEVAFLIQSILSSHENRSLTFGLQNILSSKFWTAAKTGTSKDMRDNWCIGFSQKYTVGVWVGNFSGAPMWNVSGMTGAAPAWTAIAEYLHRHEPSHAPKKPAHVVLADGQIFLKGTEGAVVQKEHQTARITQPLNGTIIAHDPDIPTDVQRLFFESTLPIESTYWTLDDQKLGSIGEGISFPRAGTHRLELFSKDGKKLDQVAFTIRGSNSRED